MGERNPDKVPQDYAGGRFCTCGREIPRGTWYCGGDHCLGPREAREQRDDGGPLFRRKQDGQTYREPDDEALYRLRAALRTAHTTALDTLHTTGIREMEQPVLNLFVNDLVQMCHRLDRLMKVQRGFDFTSEGDRGKDGPA